MSAVRVDVHTHLGERGVHVHDPLAEDEVRTTSHARWDVVPAMLVEAERQADASIVLAFDAEPVGVHVPNEYVAEAVRWDASLIGFASVNPIRPDATQRLVHAVEVLGLRGLKLGPTYQHFHAHDRECLELLEVANHYQLPVIWHQGTTFTRAAIAEYSRPLDLDLVARTFPDLPMWIAHLGHPWCEEAASVVRRHPHLYLDCSATAGRPWQLAQALVSAHEYGVTDRILFGSDFPFATIEGTVRGLETAVATVRRLGMADLDEDLVRQIRERDALALLGIADAGAGLS